MKRLFSIVGIALFTGCGVLYGACEDQSKVQELYTACTNGDLDTAQRLMMFAPVLFEQLGLTPLHLASLCGRLELVSHLLASFERQGVLKEMINCKTGEAYAPYEQRVTKERWEKHVLSGRYKWSWVQQQFFGQREFTIIDLMERISGCRLPGNLPYTPLLFACQGGHFDVVACLLDFGADVDDYTNRRTPLYIAVLKGHCDIVKILIMAGADVNKAKDDGWTPLLKASEKGLLNVVQLLLVSGADLEHTLSCGARALHIAIMNSQFNVADRLIQWEADMDAQYMGKSARTLYKLHQELAHHKAVNK